MVRLVREDALLGGARAATFLATDFFPLRLFRRAVLFEMGGDFFDEQFLGKKPVLALVTRGLALDLQTRRPMHEHDASRGLVDVLPAVSAGANKRFLEIFLADAQRGHALGKLVIVSGGCRDRTHGRSVAGGGKKLQGQSSKLKGMAKDQEPMIGPPCEFRDSAIDPDDTITFTAPGLFLVPCSFP